MNKIVKKIRDRRNVAELQRAIERASTPSMRNELLALSGRHPML